MVATVYRQVHSGDPRGLGTAQETYRARNVVHDTGAMERHAIEIVLQDRFGIQKTRCELRIDETRQHAVHAHVRNPELIRRIANQRIDARLRYAIWTHETVCTGPSDG